MNAKDELSYEHSTSVTEVECGITQRINELAIGISTNAFAQKCGIPESSMRKYLAGSIPGTDRAVQIAKACGVSLEWLATGEGSMHRNVVREPLPTYKPEIWAEFALIPRYNVDAAAGAGQAVERENEIGKLAFRQDWLRQKGLQGSDLAVIRIKGDSMSPTIRDGSLALVDCRRQHEKPKTDGIYVIQMDGDLLAKRIQIDLAGEGGLYIKSDNPAYTEQRLDAAAANRLWIVGRVIWAGGEL